MYELMNKDKVVATFEERYEFDDYTYTLIEQFDDYMPYGFTSLDEWIDDRQIAKHRTSIKSLMTELGIDNRHGFIDMVRCVSLTDTFWMRRADSGLTWNDVSLYRNSFDAVVARIAFDGAGMYGRQFSSTSPEFGTSGSFDKCWIREDDGPYLLKRGSSGYANAGFEPYSEKLCADILAVANIRHVPYELCNYHGKLASKCPLFTSEDHGFIPAGRMLNGRLRIQDVLEFCDSHGGDELFRQMIVMDAVCVNVDRHAWNYGFMVNNDTGEVEGMAPLFDQNRALLPYLMEHDDLEDYLAHQGPKIGRSFVSIARSILTSSMRAKLVALKDFEYDDPGFGYPSWKLDVANKLKRDMIDAILA